ncbi:hypothetical protein [[Mycobacterium] nativiensis]|uniref:Uncharacterized protein n=1 Tax=[Mycobacterium] nativiensis TaxID=2855503 RepID=A0ABU5XSC3_9MYCO|nr:hypothetical protein [Mycolicibacter sp. MYC340]MEB3030870.1 hypothetical protein [Mycolicibacter sp. MYC340]
MATTDSATAAQSLLALYGALDQAVTNTGDPEIEAIVERYLPGSTGTNAGWYEELLGFLNRSSEQGAGGPESPAAPDLGEALTVLRHHGPAPAQSRRMMDAGQDAAADAPQPVTLTAVQLSRMAYAIGALSHLPGYYPPEQWDAEFTQTLQLAGPGNGAELLNVLRHDFGGRNDWPQVVLSGYLTADVAAVPQCYPQIKWVRGRLCVVLTTEFTSTKVSLNDLTNVIDPLNWARCLPFFCAMDPMPIRPDGWSRVLEHFSTLCGIAAMPQMLTPLKYWKGPGIAEPVPQPTAWVDYMLDDDPVPGEHGDGAMVVDEGFIRMTSTVGDPALHGVQVRTRKVVGFRDLGWFPTALFACVLGYGYEGVQMLLGGVAKRAQEGPAGWTPWQPSTAAAGQPASPTPPGKPTPPAQPDPTQRAVTLAIEMLNDCIDEMSQRSASLAAKWAGGAPPVEESITFAADLAARLATDPWRYWQAMRTPTQGGGT